VAQNRIIAAHNRNVLDCWYKKKLSTIIIRCHRNALTTVDMQR